MAFFKAPKSQKENVCSCGKWYNILNIYCFSHLPYLCMILIVKVTLDNIFHILPLFQLKNPNLLHINYN